MESTLATLEEERRKQFRRMLAFSAAVHLLLMLFYALGPRPDRQLVLPSVVTVDLVAAAPAAGVRPRPAPPQAEPAPPKPPPPKPAPPPVPEQVVLPEEPTRPPEVKPRPAPEPQAKPEPRPAPEPPVEEEVSYEDMLAQLREEAGEDPDAPPAPAAEATADAATTAGSGSRGGPGTPVSAETMAWMRRAKMHVTRAWILQPGFRTQELETEIRVRVGPGGEVLGTEVTRSSGNPWYDESVERAIEKSSPLPPPPEADEWTFVFRPGDLM